MSPVDYHGWTHAPKEQGGTDPIPFPVSSVVGATAILRATKGAFTQTGSYQIGWDDVDVNDTSIFGISTTTQTNDTFVLKVQGVYLLVACVFPVAASTDYSVQIQLGGSMQPPAQDFPTIMAAVDGAPTMGSQALGIRLMHCTSVGGSTTGVKVVRAGSKDFSYAAAYILYWPSTTPGVLLTDIV